MNLNTRVIRSPHRGGAATTDGIGVTAGDGPAGDDDEGGEGGGCSAGTPTDSGIALGILTALAALGGLRRRRNARSPHGLP